MVSAKIVTAIDILTTAGDVIRAIESSSGIGRSSCAHSRQCCRLIKLGGCLVAGSCHNKERYNEAAFSRYQ